MEFHLVSHERGGVALVLTPVMCALAAGAWIAALADGGLIAVLAGVVLSVGGVASGIVQARGVHSPAVRVATDQPCPSCEGTPASDRTDRPAIPQPIAPDALDARSVLRALLKSLKPLAPVIGAHLWVWDETAGRVRLTAASGPMTLSTSGSTEEGVVLEAHEGGLALVHPLSRIVSPGTCQTIWRYAVPIVSGSIRGVVSVDLDAEDRPDTEWLNRTVAWYRVSLIASLALHEATGKDESARSLLAMTRDVSRALMPDLVLSTALEHAMTLVGATTGSIMLLDPGSQRLRIAAAQGLPERVIEATSVPVGEGIAGWVAATGQPLLIEDLDSGGGRGRRHGVRSALSVPMFDDDGLIGVLNVGSRMRPARFTEYHRETLGMFARHATVAWRTARAVQASREIHFETLKALALALETKDPYAMGGTERVMMWASKLGRALGIPTEEQNALEIASMLHDIGMSIVADRGAPSHRPLSTVERGLLAMHPAVAADILNHAPALRAATPIVYHHHERFDGSGYVAGLAGEQIPLGARILSVADAFVAMTSDRPYRRAFTTSQALSEMRKSAGTQFDPGIVETLVALVESGTDRVPERES